MLLPVLCDPTMLLFFPCSKQPSRRRHVSTAISALPAAVARQRHRQSLVREGRLPSLKLGWKTSFLVRFGLVICRCKLFQGWRFSLQLKLFPEMVLITFAFSEDLLVVDDWVMAINRILISCPFFLGGVQRTLHILMFIVFCSSPTQTFPKTPRSHQWVRDARQPPAIFRIFDGQHPETSASPNKKTTTAKPQVANKANKLCYPPQKLTANATFNIGF